MSIRKLTVLHINKFHYFRDGASIVYLRTAALLEARGHSSVFFSMKDSKTLPHRDMEKYFIPSVDFNDENLGLLDKLRTAGRFLYSFEAKKRILKLLNDYSVDIAHIHNIYHHISPSILHGLKMRHVPVVMTLHDYKMVCGAYAMLSQGRHCEDCYQGEYFMAAKNRCVKDSFFKSLLTAIEMYMHHKILDIYDNVDIFIAPSMFLMNKLKEMGFKKEIVHLPNFIDIKEFEGLNASIKNSIDDVEKSFVYTGRVSEEKGLRTLIEATKRLKTDSRSRNIEIKIIGEGPIREELQKKVKSEGINNVRFLGYMQGKDLYGEIKKSMALVIPSECYENNPLSVLEAFALGKPVVGARIAGIPELVRDHETGLTFESRNSDDLSLKMRYMIDNPESVAEMGRNARIFLGEKLSAEMHYERLMEIYEKAISKSASRASRKINEQHLKKRS